ncbi:hypothetical protein F4604DRAFT_1921003 [Suillus subluteus]|nr:hypothetical protein F4604DRAFT_1921003 [Suillus subluteus]
MAGQFLCQKYKGSTIGVAESSYTFKILNDAVDPDMVKIWKEQENEAQASQADDPFAMDIYEVRLEKAPGCRQTFYMWRVIKWKRVINLELPLGSHPGTCYGDTEIRHSLLPCQVANAIDKFTVTAIWYLSNSFDRDDNIQDIDLTFIEDINAPDNDWEDEYTEEDGPQALF